jgi:hypothetical protein
MQDAAHPDDDPMYHEAAQPSAEHARMVSKERQKPASVKQPAGLPFQKPPSDAGDLPLAEQERELEADEYYDDEDQDIDRLSEPGETAGSHVNRSGTSMVGAEGDDDEARSEEDAGEYFDEEDDERDELKGQHDDAPGSEKPAVGEERRRQHAAGADQPEVKDQRKYDEEDAPSDEEDADGEENEIPIMADDKEPQANQKTTEKPLDGEAAPESEAQAHPRGSEEARRLAEGKPAETAMPPAHDSQRGNDESALEALSEESTEKPEASDKIVAEVLEKLVQDVMDSVHPAIPTQDPGALPKPVDEIGRTLPPNASDAESVGLPEELPEKQAGVDQIEDMEPTTGDEPSEKAEVTQQAKDRNEEPKDKDATVADVLDDVVSHVCRAAEVEEVVDDMVDKTCRDAEVSGVLADIIDKACQAEDQDTKPEGQQPKKPEEQVKTHEKDEQSLPEEEELHHQDKGEERPAQQVPGSPQRSRDQPAKAEDARKPFNRDASRVAVDESVSDMVDKVSAAVAAKQKPGA